MEIYYLSTLISEKLYSSLYKKDEKPGIQVQVFNNLIVQGLIENGVNVKCLSAVPTSKELFDETFIKPENDLYFEYFPIINIPILKDLLIVITSFFKVRKALKKNKDLSIICDVLSVTNSLGASLACKSLNRTCVGIVTDMPEFLESDDLYIKLVHKVISNCSDYIFLTEAMNQRLNPTKKPYKIIEGMCDFTPLAISKPRTKSIMYAGSLDRFNGIDVLINAFLKVKTDHELHIYGSGDYVDEIINITKTHPNIKFFGNVKHSEIKELIQTSSFLINPRGTTHELVKYSFPSKTMEYLASGTPFLCTKLPCIPTEYFKFLNVFESDDEEGISKGIQKALDTKYEALLTKANKGQLFVLQYKNNKVQTNKIIELIKE